MVDLTSQTQGMRVLFNGGGKRTTDEEDQLRCYLFCSYFQAGVLIVRANRGSLVVVEFDWLNGNRYRGIVKPIVERYDLIVQPLSSLLE